MVSSRWDLSRKVNTLGQRELSWLNRALHINLVEVLAEVESCAEQLDQAVLDGNLDISSLLDGLLDGAGGLDLKCLTSVLCQSRSFLR